MAKFKIKKFYGVIFMSKNENIVEIKKRDGVACWKVALDELTPNTAIYLDKGLTAIIKVDGVSRTISKSVDSVNGVINPGKSKKHIGGNKSYDKFEIYVIDQSSEFDAEWGLGGEMAIPCKDGDFSGMDYKAVAFGRYYYKVANFVSFITNVQFDNTGKVTREKIREMLRAETAGIIKAYLTSQISGKDLKNCQSKTAEYVEELKAKINRHLDSKGLEVYNFAIESLSYDPRHEAERRALSNVVSDDVLVNVKCKTTDRVTDSEAKRVEKVIIPLQKAYNGDPDKKYEAELAHIRESSRMQNRVDNDYKYCPACGCKNKTSNKFCTNCGEKL